MQRVIYPGSFDPITNGHLDIIRRASLMFDQVIVAVAPNESKGPLFTPDERVALIRKALPNLPNVEIASFPGLLVDYFNERQATAIVRGLRVITDFEFEFQMALINRRLNEAVETIFLPSKEEYTYISSRIVKEICRLGGDIRRFVPPGVAEALDQKFGRRLVLV